MSRRPQQDSLEAMKETLRKLREESGTRVALELEIAKEQEILQELCDADESNSSRS